MQLRKLTKERWVGVSKCGGGVCMWWYVVACGWMARWGYLAKVLDLCALRSARP